MEYIQNPKLIPALYWMDETTGQMQAIVEMYLNGTMLSDANLKILQRYLYQWVQGFPVIPSDYKRILEMSQDQLHEYVWDVLLPIGIDPF